VPDFIREAAPDQEPKRARLRPQGRRDHGHGHGLRSSRRPTPTPSRATSTPPSTTRCFASMPTCRPTSRSSAAEPRP
jgi:hypothetical protein